MTFGPGSFRMRNSYCLLQLLPFSVLFLHGFGFCFVSLVVQLVKNPPAMQETWVHPWVGKIPWRRERLPTPVFWPGKFHGLYSPWGQLSDFQIVFNLFRGLVLAESCLVACSLWGEMSDFCMGTVK